MVDPEVGFTSDIIKDPSRFVGRHDMIRDCIRALNNPLGLIAIYGKRGVGKSSLLRQIQTMALGDYKLAELAGLHHEIPAKPRKYLTVYYTCDALIDSASALLTRLCNDQHDEDGLLRLVPEDGKQLIEFSRTIEASGGVDLKLINVGTKGGETNKYAKIVPNDTVQTFRNFVNSVILHQVKNKMKRDGLLILLDEFDVIKDKSGIGSLIKSLSSNELKFGICGIGNDLTTLVQDHMSVERLLEQGVVHVKPMPEAETMEILNRSEKLFRGKIRFEDSVKQRICQYSEGYPYFTQMLGRACVDKANIMGKTIIDDGIFGFVLDDIKSGKAFPSLERTYQTAIGHSKDRQWLLHLLADQQEDKLNEDAINSVALKDVRKDAEDLSISNIYQVVPRLVEEKNGSVLTKIPNANGVYEFTNPVFRLYVRLRTM